jgi:hypothetical protein
MDWIQAGIEYEVNFSYYINVKSKFATVRISCINMLCDDCKGGKSSEEAEEGDRCEQETCAELYQTTHCLQNC